MCSPRSISENLVRICTPPIRLKSKFVQITPCKSPRLRLFVSSITPRGRVVESLTNSQIKRSLPSSGASLTKKPKCWQPLLVTAEDKGKYLSPHRCKMCKKVKSVKNMRHVSPLTISLTSTPNAIQFPKTIKDKLSNSASRQQALKNIPNLRIKISEKALKDSPANLKRNRSGFLEKSISDHALDKCYECSSNISELFCPPVASKYQEVPQLRDAVNFDTPVRNDVFHKGVDGFRSKPHILGRGGFGIVVLADSKGERVAIKVINKRNSKRRRSIEISIQNEENAIWLHDHPNVVKTFSVFGGKEQHALIVMEFAGMRHLAHILENASEVIDHHRRLIFVFQLASALQWCHHKCLAHLDVKPANVIVNNNDLCKLGDFGCSKQLDKALATEDWHFLGGTIAYKAPELLCHGIPSLKADVYSLGITMWQILTRARPFNGWDPHVIIYKVVSHGIRPINPPLIDSCNLGYMNLYCKLWLRDRTLRPTMDDVVRRILHLQELLT